MKKHDYVLPDFDDETPGYDDWLTGVSVAMKEGFQHPLPGIVDKAAYYEGLAAGLAAMKQRSLAAGLAALKPRTEETP